ncbi:hypothetical protein ABZ461_28830 [Actinacidiphila glaucinigra]|uniref:hypothetical protein n=1 Tax=Actinacidiphila glaucinigra TaxID=235986 RepID=UPI0033DCABBF
MGVIETVVIVVVVCLAGLGWRRHRYPGGWAFAFSGDHRADRQDLHRARRTVRDLQEKARRELTAAHGQVAQADLSYRSRVSSAERKLKQLREPGRGLLQAALGPVTLYKHVAVVVTRSAAVEVRPLGGLDVRFERTPLINYIYLTQPDGQRSLAHFEADEHPEASVRDFSVRIQNAVATENRFLKERPGSIKTAEEELKAAQSHTTAAEEAREHLSVVTSRQSRNQALKDALVELEAALERWRSLTGRRPPA